MSLSVAPLQEAGGQATEEPDLAVERLVERGPEMFMDPAEEESARKVALEESVTDAVAQGLSVSKRARHKSLGFLFGLLNLPFDFIQRIRQSFLLEAADKRSAIPLLLCCNTHLAQLRRLRFQFQLKPSLPHYALLMRKIVPSLAPTFILSRCHIA